MPVCVCPNGEEGQHRFMKQDGIDQDHSTKYKREVDRDRFMIWVPHHTMAKLEIQEMVEAVERKFTLVAKNLNLWKTMQLALLVYVALSSTRESVII
jgi:hypothetical protein